MSSLAGPPLMGVALVTFKPLLMVLTFSSVSLRSAAAEFRALRRERSRVEPDRMVVEAEG